MTCFLSAHFLDFRRRNTEYEKKASATAELHQTSSLVALWKQIYRLWPLQHLSLLCGKLSRPPVIFSYFSWSSSPHCSMPLQTFFYLDPLSIPDLTVLRRSLFLLAEILPGGAVALCRSTWSSGAGYPLLAYNLGEESWTQWDFRIFSQ